MNPPHKLLIGVWKSDRRRTLKFCHRYHCLNGAKKRKFAGLFGKLEMRFTEKYVYHTLRDFKYRSRYEVVADDAESVVLRFYSDDLKKKFDPLMADAIKDLFSPRLEQIHFVRHRGQQYYWIGLGSFCEWFKKCKT